MHITNKQYLELFGTEYDLIFGIGEACSCSQILRKCHLQFFSYPFDWLYGSDILTRAKILTSNYEGFIDFDDLEDIHTTNDSKKHPCEAYHNKRNDITFNHDFPYGEPFEKAYCNVKAKYQRRAERQIKQIEKSENVLVIYIQTPNNQDTISDNTLIETHNILSSRFTNQKITLLYLYCNHENKDIKFDKISKNIIKGEFDYNGYNKEFPYVVNEKLLEKTFYKLKITNKFMNIKNKIRRKLYLVKQYLKRREK